MAPYKIDLRNLDGSIREARVIECDHDDEVIDRVGELDHPHTIDVWQAERHVARFPPWPPLTFYRAAEV